MEETVAGVKLSITWGQIDFVFDMGMLEFMGASGPENVYAIRKDVEIHFITKNGQATWANLYVGGLLMDLRRRLPPSK